jgi:hypothetical protein
LDLTADSNLSQVAGAIIEAGFTADVLTRFLRRVEAQARQSGRLTPLEQMRAEQEHQRTVGLLQDFTAPRRGPYGLRRPGVLVQALGAVELPLYNMYRSAKGFVRGVLTGFRQATSEAEYDHLLAKLGSSTVITAVFPVLFVGGALYGIGKDIVQAIVVIYNAIVNFSEVLEAALELVRVMVSDRGEEVGEALGVATGGEFSRRLRELLRQNIFEFTFNLGRIIGPTIVYAIISLLGLPAIVGAVGISLRAVNTFRAVLNRIPGARRLRAFLRLHRMRRRGRGGGDGGDGTLLDDVVIQGGRTRLTIAHLWRWEKMGGHALQRHGPFHTRTTLLRRVFNETSLGGPPAPRNLTGGVRTTDFRVWRGRTSRNASAWRDQDSMLEGVGRMINENIDEINDVTSRGGRMVLERHDLSRPVGRGWVEAVRGHGERAIFWTEDLRHATVVIDPHPAGGWYVVTAFPEM